MKETQKTWIRLWTITSLLNDEKITQRQIIDYLDNIDTVIREKDPHLTTLNTTKSLQSAVIKDLEKKGIVNIKRDIVPNTNIRGNFCSLNKSLDAFVNIFFEIDDFNIDKNRENFFILTLINSKYGDYFIDDDLIPKLFKKYNIEHFKLEESDKKKITAIFQSSPTALKNTILSIANKEEELKKSNFKDILINRIYGSLYEDLLYLGKNDYTTHARRFTTTIDFNLDLELYDEHNYCMVEVKPKDNGWIIKSEQTIQPTDINLNTMISTFVDTYKNDPKYGGQIINH